jgi:hypothetical protein
VRPHYSLSSVFAGEGVQMLDISMASLVLSVDMSFEIIIVTDMMFAGFQDMKLCSLIERFQYFRGTCSLHLHC